MPPDPSLRGDFMQVNNIVSGQPLHIAYYPLNCASDGEM